MKEKVAKLLVAEGGGVRDDYRWHGKRVEDSAVFFDSFTTFQNALVLVGFDLGVNGELYSQDGDPSALAILDGLTSLRTDILASGIMVY